MLLVIGVNMSLEGIIKKPLFYSTATDGNLCSIASNAKENNNVRGTQSIAQYRWKVETNIHILTLFVTINIAAPNHLTRQILMIDEAPTR